MHTYIHTSIHTYIHTSMTYIHTYIHTYMYTHLNIFVYTKKQKDICCMKQYIQYMKYSAFAIYVDIQYMIKHIAKTYSTVSQYISYLGYASVYTR